MRISAEVTRLKMTSETLIQFHRQPPEMLFTCMQHRRWCAQQKQQVHVFVIAFVSALKCSARISRTSLTVTNCFFFAAFQLAALPTSSRVARHYAAYECLRKKNERVAGLRKVFVKKFQFLKEILCGLAQT